VMLRAQNYLSFLLPFFFFFFCIVSLLFFLLLNLENDRFVLLLFRLKLEFNFS
jgi:hypothetical protein